MHRVHVGLKLLVANLGPPSMADGLLKGKALVAKRPGKSVLEMAFPHQSVSQDLTARNPEKEMQCSFPPATI